MAKTSMEHANLASGRTRDWRVGIGAAIPLRGDFDAAQLRGLAQRSGGGAQNRRLLALAVIYDGHRRSDAARFAGVGLSVNQEFR